MKTRILSGIVLVIIMASALVCGSWYLFGLNLMIALIGMFELYRVIHMEKTVMAYAGYIACILYYICIGAGRDEYLLLVLAAAVMAVMAVYVFAFPKYRTENVCITLLGLVYVAMLLSYIYKVRTYHDGIYTVWLIFAASWVNDTFAYFTGVFFGRHKMAPKLSPKKSVEGGIGGVVASAGVGGIYGFLVSPHMSGVIAYPVVTFAAASFIGAFFAIVGDLAASAIKRNHDVKDYGTLIPGHGGILDRFDSVIFTAPAVYWAVYLINQFL